MTSNTSSGLETNRSVAPFTNGTRFLSSCTARFTLDTAGSDAQSVNGSDAWARGAADVITRG